tara:strand:- start:80 stop:307 length:228 start_codon:yes stop_codon:yes gene_type:complete
LLLLGYKRPELFEYAVKILFNLGLKAGTSKYGIIDGRRDQLNRSYKEKTFTNSGKTINKRRFPLRLNNQIEKLSN